MAIAAVVWSFFAVTTNVVCLASHRHPDDLTPSERAHMRLMTACSRLNEVSMGEVDATMLDDVRRLLDEAGEAVVRLDSQLR